MTPEDRKRIMDVPLCGPRAADFLEMIGITSFDALADADARELKIRVNLHLGRPFINAMGVRAFQNAIDGAKAARARQSAR